MAGLTHIKQLEAESIHILREVVAEFEHPVMLYSIGKDSSVLLHLARKAFFPGRLPFPLMHVDTTWKFREMIAFRDRMARELDLDLIVHTNEEGVRNGVTPFTYGSRKYTDIMKTHALLEALDKHGFDAAFGGARRDEERSRAKERVYSVRDGNHRWDPRSQRPELWNLYNGNINRGEEVRVFPLSNWTELDIWQYILAEGIELVPLYFAAPRPVVQRDGTSSWWTTTACPSNPGSVRRRAWSGSAPSAAIPCRAPSNRRRPRCPRSSKRCCARSTRSGRDGSSTSTRPAPWSKKSAKATSDGTSTACPIRSPAARIEFVQGPRNACAVPARAL